MFNPSLHLLITPNTCFLICFVHLLGKIEDIRVVWCDIRDFFSLSHRLGLPDHVPCQAFCLVVGSFRAYCFPRLTGLNQGYEPLETFSLLLGCLFKLVIPPPYFSFPLVLLERPHTSEAASRKGVFNLDHTSYITS